MTDGSVTEAPGHPYSTTSAVGSGGMKWHVPSSAAWTAVLLMLALAALTVILRPNTASAAGVSLLLGPALPLAFASLAQMTIVMLGDFDMGVGFAVGLVNVLTATVLSTNVWFGVGLLVAMVLAYVAMGAIVEFFQVPAIVVTLGASFIWLGVGLTVQPTPGGTAPAWLEQVANASLPVIPEVVYILAGVALVSWWLLRVWRYGVVLRGLGNNRPAVESSGWSPVKARLSAYAIAGVFVCLAGLFTTSVTTSADVNASGTLTLTTFAAILIGGCRFKGGFVEPIGVVAAVDALSLLTSVLAFLNVSSTWDTGAEGLVIVVAVSAKWAVQGLGQRFRRLET